VSALYIRSRITPARATWLAAIERQKKISTAVRAVRHQS
jgi:hypothetical protein